MEWLRARKRERENYAKYLIDNEYISYGTPNKSKQKHDLIHTDRCSRQRCTHSNEQMSAQETEKRDKSLL